MEAQPPPIYVVIPGRVYRRDSRRHPHADVPPGRGPGGRRGHHAGRPQGHAAGLRARDLRRRPRGAPAPALLPVHRAERRGRRLLLPLRRRRAGCATAARCPLCKGEGWIEILGAGMVDPNVFGYVREHGYDPERVQGFAFGHGHRARSRCSSTACPTCGCSTTTTCASWSSSDEGPRCDWLQRVLRPRPRRRSELGERLTMTGTKVERVHHHGVGGARALRRRARCSSAEQHPDADRLSVCMVDVGDGDAAADRLRRAQRRRRPDRGRRAAGRGHARRHEARRGQAARRRVDGMILAEDEVGDRHRPRRDHGARRRAGARARRSPSVLPIATDVLELEITPNRPDCLGVYGVAREVHAATGAPLGAAAVGATTRTAPATIAGRRDRRVERPGPVPALHRARVRGRADRPVAARG